MSDRPPIEWDDDGPVALRHVAAGAAVGVGFLFGAGVLLLVRRSLREGA
ncbi:hypothetical protein [Haloplanus natans]|nr:hypothetical protein [Haloplanus natans]